MKECYNNSTIGFLLKLQLANKEESSLIYTKRVKLSRRGAHGLLKEGAPSGMKRLPSVGERAPPLHTHQTSVNKVNYRGEDATS
jgi:hypothetical protein